MFQANLRVLSRTLLLRLDKKMSNFHVLVDISETTASNLAYLIGFFTQKILLIANAVVVLNLLAKVYRAQTCCFIVAQVVKQN